MTSCADKTFQGDNQSVGYPDIASAHTSVIGFPQVTSVDVGNIQTYTGSVCGILVLLVVFYTLASFNVIPGHAPTSAHSSGKLQNDSPRVRNPIELHCPNTKHSVHPLSNPINAKQQGR